jgi:hypothetical protein
VASEFSPDLDLIGGSLFVNGLIDNDLVESVNL